MKQILLVMVLTFISLGAFAQNDKSDKMGKKQKTHKMEKDVDHEPHAMLYADKMKTRLNLTTEQKERIKEAQMDRLESQKEFMAEMMDENGNMGSENAEKKAEKTRIQQDFKEEMRAILNSDQYNDWEPMHDREMKLQGKKNKMKNKNKAKMNKKLEDDY